MPHGDPRQFAGRVQLVPPEGLSLVSDIDDTIKLSQVRERRELMLNTFAREFVAVPGMAERYQSLAGDGTRFHYVSGSPVQLYPPIAVFLRTGGFPGGSVHLRESTSIRNVIPEHGATRTHKLAAIGQLLADFPARRFLLVGDSGEADPEIYAELARAHPAQIVGIRIRDVSGEDAGAPRYRETFGGLPAALWQVYTDPASLRAP
jgi:phosphatidate phosphatase APP1